MERANHFLLYNDRRVENMLPQTHMMISEQVVKNTEQALGFSLHKASLTYGSVKPDIAPQLLKLAHFKPQSFDLICNRIDHLASMELDINVETMKFVSREIGVITHFISDFFCVPHNDRKTYKNNFMNHLAYENNLHKLFKEKERSMNQLHFFSHLHSNPAQGIRKVIDDFHQEYLALGDSPEYDHYYSIMASSLVSIYITEQVLGRSGETRTEQIA